MGGIALEKGYAIDMLRDKAADIFVKFASKGQSEGGRQFVESVMPILKLLSAMWGAADAATDLTLTKGIKGMVGYDLMLMGPMLMTDAVMADPTGNNDWWCYDTVPDIVQ